MATTLLSVGASGLQRPVTLGAEIGRGGAGIVYALNGDRERAAKLYLDPRAAAVHLPKLRAMLLTPPNLPPIERQGVRYVQMAWPESVLNDANGAPAGFIMPRVPLHRAE